MINLDQVRTLEWKVKQAVQLIVHLRRENDTLRGRLSDTEVRLQELESLLEAFKATQNEMESGIRSALEELDNLEGAPAPEEVGSVDPLSYPPASVAESAPEAVAAPVPEAAPEVVAEAQVEAEAQPEAEFEPEGEAEPEAFSAAPEGQVDEPVASAVSDEERSFEEEFAALAAAEAAAQPEAAFEPSPEPVPESVELEADVHQAEAGLFDEPAPEPAVEREPEQPGLGIF